MLEAGKHLLLDKPMVMNAKEGERLVAAAKQRPKQVQFIGMRRIAPRVVASPRDPSSAACVSDSRQLALVDHELRFAPSVREARQLLREGAIGAVLNVEAAFVFRSFTARQVVLVGRC